MTEFIEKIPESEMWLVTISGAISFVLMSLMLVVRFRDKRRYRHLKEKSRTRWFSSFSFSFRLKPNEDDRMEINMYNVQKLGTTPKEKLKLRAKTKTRRPSRSEIKNSRSTPRSAGGKIA